MTAWNILYRDCEEALGAARDVVARLEHVLASFEFKPVRGLRFPGGAGARTKIAMKTMESLESGAVERKPNFAR